MSTGHALAVGLADKKVLLTSAEPNRDTQNQIWEIYSHELPLVHTSEMTLDYCFFCHDKKHFCVVKGHFCSFLVSSIYWLTSLSTDYEVMFDPIVYSILQIIQSFHFSFSEKLLFAGIYFDQDASFWSFFPSVWFWYFLLFRIMVALDDPLVLIVLLRDLIFLWMIFGWFLMVEFAMGLALEIRKFKFLEELNWNF